MSKTPTVSIRILDKDYQVACPPEQQDELKKAALFLDEKMRGIRKGSRVVGIDRIAIMASLNITHEMLYGERPSEGMSPKLKGQLEELNGKIDNALDHFTESLKSYKAAKKTKATSRKKAKA